MGRRTLDPSFRRPGTPTGWFACALLIVLATPHGVRAQCAPDPTADGDVITCAGADLDGLDAGAFVDLTVTVEDAATVTNGAATDTIRLNTGNTVTVEDGGAVSNDAANGRAIVAGDTGNTITIEDGGVVSIDGAGGRGIEVGTRPDDTMPANTVTNLGLVQSNVAGAVGIQAGSDGNSVRNDATDALLGIQLVGDGAMGIVAGDDNTSIVNDGTLNLTGADTVGVSGGNDNNLIGNDTAGRITMMGARGIGVRVGDGNSGGNAGVISMTGDDGIGMLLGDDNDFGNDDPMDGGTPLTGISVSGNNGIGVSMGDSNMLENRGTIEATGAGGRGVFAGTASGTDGNQIDNRGTIRGSSAGVSFAGSGAGAVGNLLDNRGTGTIEGLAGPAILGSAGTETINQAGSIIGDVFLLGGDDRFTFADQSSTTGSVDGGAGDDTFVFQGTSTNGDIRGGTGDDTFVLLTGAVPSGTLDGGAETTGDIFALEDGAGPGSFDLSTPVGFEALEVRSGTWNLTGNGGFANGSRFEAASVARVAAPVMLGGDVSLGAGSTLEVVLDPNGTSGLLESAQTITIDAGARLVVTPASPIVSEAVFPLLRAGTAIAGSFDPGGLPADTAVLDFTLVPSANQIDLQVLRRPYAAAAGSPNATAIAGGLDALLGAGTPGDLGTLLGQLDVLDPSSFGSALATLSPEAYDAHTSANLWIARSVADAVTGREPRCEEVELRRQPPEVAADPCGEKGWKPWVALLGSLGSRDGDRGQIDYDHVGTGLTFGADRRVGPWIVSGYVGATTAALDVDEVGDGSFFTAEFGVAARVAVANAHLRAVLGYGHGWHDQDRDLRVGSFQRSASGDFDSDRLHARLEAGAMFHPIDWIGLEPVGSVEYTWLREERVSESGGGAALVVDARDSGVLATTVGFRVGARMVRFDYIGEALEWAVGVWRTELDVRWHSVWLDADRDLEARFRGSLAGGGFEVEAEDADQGALVQLGTTFQPYKAGVLVGLRYRGYLATDRQVHAGTLELEIPL